MQGDFFRSWSSTGPAPAPGGSAASLRLLGPNRSSALEPFTSQSLPEMRVRSRSGLWGFLSAHRFALFKETHVRRGRGRTCFCGGGEAPSSADNPGLLRVREEHAGGTAGEGVGGQNSKIKSPLLLLQAARRNFNFHTKIDTLVGLDKTKLIKEYFLS